MGELKQIAWRSKSREHLLSDLARALIRSERKKIEEIYTGEAVKERRDAQQRIGVTPDNAAWGRSSVIYNDTRALIHSLMEMDRVPSQLVDDVIRKAVEIFRKRKERQRRRTSNSEPSVADRTSALVRALRERYGWTAAQYTYALPTYYPGLRAWADPMRVTCLTVEGPFQLRWTVKFRGLGDELTRLIQQGHSLRMVRRDNHRLLELDGKLYTLPQLLIEHCGFVLDQPEEKK